jgi:hypothetical protein
MLRHALADDAETATRWPARGCALAVIENAVAFLAAAHAARTVVESELGA